MVAESAIGASSEKRLHRILVTETRRFHERRDPSSVGEIDPGAALEEEYHHLGSAKLRCKRKRRLSPGIRGVRIRPLLEKTRDRVRLAARRRPHESRESPRAHFRAPDERKRNPRKPKLTRHRWLL